MKNVYKFSTACLRSVILILKTAAFKNVRNHIFDDVVEHVWSDLLLRLA